MSEQPVNRRLTVVGIWIGSPAQLPPLRREGVFRFLLNLVQHLAEYESLRFEIWCHQINLTRVRELFAPLLDQPGMQRRVVFCTEFGRSDGLPPTVSGMRMRLAQGGARLSHGSRVAAFAIKELLSRYRHATRYIVGALSLMGLALLLVLTAQGRLPVIVLIPILLLSLAALLSQVLRSRAESLVIVLWEAFKNFGNVLPVMANSRSAAECFLVQNIDIANSVRLSRPKVVNLHDLYTSEYASLFAASARSRRLRAQGLRAARAAEKLARTGARFVSNSDHIRRTHALRLIRGLPEEHSAVVLLPGPVPYGIRERLPERDAVLQLFRIAPPYLFYATHIRPYKNVLTLLKALAAVREEGRDLRLVLTGRLADDVDCAEFAAANRLNDHVISTGELSEAQMFAIYRDAALVAVPTLSEGGFPWQALEAMAMEVPVVVSRIPVVLERLAYHGFLPDACGLRMFEPTDDSALARLIVELLENRDDVLREQAAVRRALLSYSWRDVARQYHEILEAAVGGEQHV